MERRHFIIGCIASSLLWGCKGEPGNDGESAEQQESSNISLETPRGFAEAGPMLGYSEVIMWPLNENYLQIGDPYTGSTKADDSGSFSVYAVITSPNIQTKVRGEAFNETSGSYDSNVVLESTIPTSAGVFNANYFTSIVSIVGNYLYHEDEDGDYYQDPDAFLAAEVMVHNYFNYSGLWAPAVKKSYEMSLTGESLDDAKLVLINSTIALGKDGPEQGNFAQEIAEDIYTGALSMKASVNSTTSGLKLKTIKDNLDNYYSSRSLAYDCAPMWNLPGVAAYYADLLNRTPNVMEEKNTIYSSTSAVDASYTKFAYPISLSQSNTKYISLNLGGNLSIYSIRTHPDGYLCPDSKIANLSVLNDNLLPDNLGYNYSVDSDVLAGQYFIMQEFDSPSRPSKLTVGDMTPFGRNIVSHDGVDWLGFDNLTSFFRRSIKYITYD